MKQDCNLWFEGFLNHKHRAQKNPQNGEHSFIPLGLFWWGMSDVPGGWRKTGDAGRIIRCWCGSEQLGWVWEGLGAAEQLRLPLWQSGPPPLCFPPIARRWMSPQCYLYSKPPTPSWTITFCSRFCSSPAESKWAPFVSGGDCRAKRVRL